MQGTEKNKQVVWVLDSRCSGHMTGDIALLSHFEERVGPEVTFGHNNIGIILGYGNLEVGNVIIQDVALVKELKAHSSKYDSVY